MRALRPVAQQETLVCWGTYHYFKERQPTGLAEEWTFHRLSDGTEIVRADVDARKVPDTPDVLTHYVRSPEGRPQELILQYRKGSLYAKATYTFHRGHVELVRDVADHSTRRETIEVAANYIVDYHAVVARDYAWRGYPDYMEGRTYAAPIFRVTVETEEVSDLLSGVALRVDVQPLEAASLTIPPGAYTDVRRYEVAVPDGTQAVGWYDEHGTLLRWSWAAQGYEYVLMRYRYQDTEEQPETE
jgi:hypothetical protein